MWACGRPARDARLCTMFLDAAAQLAQGVEHDARVVGFQQVVHRGRALAQGCQQQHAIGDAFGAGQLHAALGRLERGEIKKGGGIHRKLSGAMACRSTVGRPPGAGLAVFEGTLCAHAPVCTGFAGQGEHVLNGLGVVAAHGLLEALQGLLE